MAVEEDAVNMENKALKKHPHDGMGAFVISIMPSDLQLLTNGILFWKHCFCDILPW